jgi:hypothetical protein
VQLTDIHILTFHVNSCQQFSLLFICPLPSALVSIISFLGFFSHSTSILKESGQSLSKITDLYYLRYEVRYIWLKGPSNKIIIASGMLQRPWWGHAMLEF